MIARLRPVSGTPGLDFEAGGPGVPLKWRERLGGCAPSVHDANTFVIFDGIVTGLLVAPYVSMAGWTAAGPHRWPLPARQGDRAEPPTRYGRME